MSALSHLRKHWDHLDPSHLRHLQAVQLREYLTAMLPFSAHYRQFEIDPRQIRSLEDMALLPFTSKSDLLPTEDQPSKAREFVLIPDPEILKRRPSTIARAILTGRNRVKDELDREFRPILMTSTTGRSTEPVPFLYTAHDLKNMEISGRRLIEIGGSKREYKHLNMFPFAPHLAFWQTHYACIGTNAFGLSTGGGKVMGTEGNVALIKKIQPDVIIGMPTFIYHVMQQAVVEGIQCKPLKIIVLGGEKVPEGMRRKLRALCAEMGAGKVDVLSTYGFTEAKAAWPECPTPPNGTPAGYHIYPDLGIVEVVDPETGKALPPGTPGEIVYTPLDSRGSVVLRYRTGDEISEGLSYEPCPICQRVLPRLVGKISRVSDYRRLRIDKLKGTLVNFNELEHILDDIDEIGSWQIEIRKTNDDPLESDELVVHVNRRAGGNRISEQQLVDRIRKKFYICAEIRPNKVLFHSAEEMRKRHGVGENLKEEKIVDRRPQAAKPGTTGARNAGPIAEPAS